MQFQQYNWRPLLSMKLSLKWWTSNLKIVWCYFTEPRYNSLCHSHQQNYSSSVKRRIESWIRHGPLNVRQNEDLKFEFAVRKRPSWGWRQWHGGEWHTKMATRTAATHPYFPSLDRTLISTNEQRHRVDENSSRSRTTMSSITAEAAANDAIIEKF